MITKLIVFAATRKEAIAKMHRALGEVIIEGITTNIDFLYEIMERPDYQEGDFTIQYLKKVLEERSQEIKSKIHILFCIFEMYFLSIRLT